MSEKESEELLSVPLSAMLVAVAVAGKLIAEGKVPRSVSELGATLSKLEASGLFGDRSGTEARGGVPGSVGGEASGGPMPAVPIEESVTPEYLVCLECGREMKQLRRHLRQAHGLTAEQYLAKWRLQRHYPMTCAETHGVRSRIGRAVAYGDFLNAEDPEDGTFDGLLRLPTDDEIRDLLKGIDEDDDDFALYRDYLMRKKVSAAKR